MNNKARNFIANFSYTLISNLISLIISTLVVMIIPKLIGVEQYGYWQLYLFYSSYVGFLHLGWIDGIYLRYGGKTYEELDKNKFFSQFHMLSFTQFAIAVFVFFVTFVINMEGDKGFILQMTAICLFVSNLRNMLNFILQGTNRIKEFAQITLIDRITYIALILIFLLAGVKEYKLMIIADLIGKLISLIYAMYTCKEIVFRKVSSFYINIKEAITNINVGIKLMFSNIASMLVIGIVRFGIERYWDVSTFGKVSLTLSISNLLMIFINAVGIIMFPLLRRTDKKKLPAFYILMRTFIMVIMMGFLLFYHPLRVVLSAWLPQYKDSLMFMALLFPLSAYEGLTALLINTYLKTMREEKAMMYINLVTMGLSLAMTGIFAGLLHNLNLTILSITMLLSVRCILAETYLTKKMKISVKKDIILEVVLVAIFMFSGWFINSWLTSLIYLGVYMVYLLLKKKDIVSSYKSIRELMKL
ncbi:MAG: hypothetical protein WBI17_03865 [Clostridiaceae bacterium]